ncbi:TspO/MBR family protein [Xanthomarina sp. F2636L]|uniref:TspO/MBR family protein n=1 Tax=Xanthomarina sp. F2636L TaxID=2996018 RepID=UPI00225DF7E9|nr:TspO/MBR family protein [Xanthomarina sp. F2636L]MCX7549583.1 tryptophan-rich sensory protein [Xanthomarina sp. F2636L]
MSRAVLIILFLVINFFALGLGRWFMGSGATSDWYLGLNKAPWTPPGWVFGAAWTLIMVCFSFYMASLVKSHVNYYVIGLFVLQLSLNILWNYAFFNQHLVVIGLIIIVVLTLVVAFLLFKYMAVLQLETWLIVPYLVWLLIATSLNAYIFYNN